MIAIREATTKGYVEIKPGDVFDASYPESKTRRGRLQGGGRDLPYADRRTNGDILL